ncbi:ribosome small subunit-dependent GTPase A [Mesoplasma florum]|uniref:ribosome small subunit-dependent GTPase A n=1 Tax=Mesoplasma florum TaxID=2151 RepID=UPI000BE28AD9|nr:ribosome small subunit-dependent GTPase A [Mesoplasma florum]ATI73864.1 ribosome small subunit-dependent GTPase A [Mesoplasma florum]AVN64963.1 ribosome small subunit-dependent GTPase A [Mesoplasma florum]
MKGKIIQIDSNVSFVLTEEQKIYEVFIKGNVKKEIKPLVGDDVEFELIENEKGNITKILSRKNEIYRPRIANVDQVIIVTSLFEPLFASYILNKYIFMIEAKKIKPILLFTKNELLVKTKYYDEVTNKINSYKELGYEIVVLDNIENKNYLNEIDNLRKKMIDKVSFFTGQTGAGKSTTLNNYLFQYQIKTNEISLKLNRGKHTTTNVKIYNLPDNILIADTPGFSSFELVNLEIEDILRTSKILNNFNNHCKFIDCIHIHEKKCGVKEAVEQNKIPDFIYEDYKKIYEEISNRKVKY